MIAWKAIDSCLATEKFLHKKGFYLPSCCHFCFTAEEDKDHFFVGCDTARTIWAKLESAFHARLDKIGIQQLILAALNYKMSKQVYNLWIAESDSFDLDLYSRSRFNGYGYHEKDYL
ncbi:hypothetical protein TIFTF001_008152 [Ficus carica]|uniref:Reverse transcriptase zinc-binding domain-containing protein n=1 Tax=Ficus carica TaxID=3494 RepID=A0AA88A490_FICCA|nr:hypothetical protein TIFTF001_008152 [Ficus carica]